MHQIKKVMTLSTPKGFTLVELLVVISIIGVLVAVVGVNLITAQKQARDSRRMQDMESTQTAFETYYTENQSYPTTTAQINSSFDSNTPPADPKGTSTYTWGNVAASSYCICATMEAKTGNASSGSSSGCTWSTNPATALLFCVQNRQ